MLLGAGMDTRAWRADLPPGATEPFRDSTTAVHALHLSPLSHGYGNACGGPPIALKPAIAFSMLVSGNSMLWQVLSSAAAQGQRGMQLT